MELVVTLSLAVSLLAALAFYGDHVAPSQIDTLGRAVAATADSRLCHAV
ncbi:hypothetical protein OB905_10240 [Halobacteria archaeon AArc-dxtr1]|nr:hypothetical protein [Halobacteria archaeon AArc-dxtr1]